MQRANLKELEGIMSKIKKAKLCFGHAPTWEKPLKFSDVNAAALSSMPTLLFQLLPNGLLEGDEYTALNPTRVDRRRGSFKINIRTGQWCDFATGDKGGDPISLYAYLNGCSQGIALRELAKKLGVRS